MKNSSKPLLAITMGDPAGIGPEIIAKTFTHDEIYQMSRCLVVGDSRVMARANQIAGTDHKIHPIEDVQSATFQPGTIDVFDLKNVDLSQLKMGKISAMAGNAAYEYIVKAIELAKAGLVDGTVTAPIHKEALNQAGHHFPGHTEIYAQLTGTEDFAMLLVDENLRVIHVCTHVPVRKIPEFVKKDRVYRVIRLLDDACRKFGVKEPKIGVAGLNPHASDGGLFGTEEREEIIPAIEKARTEGIDIEGPVPPDVLFPKAKGGLYDGCVAMYHDQGHIPFKLLRFQWDQKSGKMADVSGVNITMGLPIIRTSVDHGTAFEIAGKGVASPTALIQAIRYAALLAKKRG